MRRDDRRPRLELAIFLWLLLPPIVLGWWTDVASASFATSSIATILHDIGLTALALFLLWSSGRPLADAGVTARRAGREIALGAALYIPMLMLLVAIAAVLRALGLEPVSTPHALFPRSAGQVALAVVLVVVVAFTEEVIFRGYLLLRLRELTGSTATAVACTTLVFASGHVYEGASGLIAVTALGVVFALVYLWRRSLVAPIVMHFLQDFFGLVILPRLLH